MANLARKKLHCPSCNTTKLVGEFYKTYRTDEYPTGRLNFCKVCRTMMVNNWDESTFIDIMEECDVPWIPQEWNKLLETYGQDPLKCSGTTIMGRYLSKMQLSQFNSYRWADSEKIQEEKAAEIEDMMTYQGFSKEEIDETILRNKTVLKGPGDSIKPLPSDKNVEPPPPVNDGLAFPAMIQTSEPLKFNPDGTVNDFAAIPDYFTDENDVSYEDDLTDDDRKYLRLKWGKTYSADELVRLERLYNEMEQSFDIQTASHRDTLIKACKTSLKSDQLLDIGDVEGAQKMIKMYETLMKMGKFTAVQNKTEQGECLDSISELVLLCEREGFIPRFYTDKPNDKVDETLMDLKEYVTDLVKGEANLGNMIETAVKQIYEQEHREEDDDVEDEELTFENLDEIVHDEDFVNFNEFIEGEQDITDESIKNYMGGEV